MEPPWLRIICTHTWPSCFQYPTLFLTGGKSCPSGINAIDFSSSCHLDKSDDPKPFFESMRTRLQVVVNEFKNLCSLGMDFVEARYQVAKNALQHILWWGVCLPTTCCYQYVGLQLGCLFLFDRNLFLGLKNKNKKDSWGFLFFPVFSGGIFHRSVVLEGSQEFLFFAAVTGIFRRNSFGTGPVFTPDSSGFLRIPPDSCSRQTLSCSGQRLK